MDRPPGRGRHPAVNLEAAALSETAALAVIALVAVVPLAAVLALALLRGYTIHLSMWRPGMPRRRRRDQGDP